jgi:Fur family peroxide stress response transcriptional regulator
MKRRESRRGGDALSERLRTGGFRHTPQRRHVYEVLLRKRDHPTADEVFLRAKQAMPGISMATVYNSLDALVRSGLVRQVTVERGGARFCPNMREHCHFYCDVCEQVFDIELRPGSVQTIPVPRGFKAARFDIAVHGSCPACAKK